MASFELDRIDRKIIRELQLDGRSTNVELASRVHLSPSQCLRRTRRLEKTGVISGYTAIIDHRKMGYMLRAYVLVTVTTQVDRARDMVMDFLMDKEDVLSIHGVAGNIDMIIELQAMNIEHFTELVIEQIYGHKYVVNTTSYITLDTRK
jgi:Lrp/AsnC family transcriptional regulator, leucine-responsive regulatory protein